jgi:hypothetical protein
MKKGDLPPSKLTGDMVELPTPCGRHVVYYPAILAQMSIHRQVYFVFQTGCECGTGYIVATQPDGAHFRKGGVPEAIMEFYESIPWKEQGLDDDNGIFFYKEAPSLDALLAYFAPPAQ